MTRSLLILSLAVALAGCDATGICAGWHRSRAPARAQEAPLPRRTTWTLSDDDTGRVLYSVHCRESDAGRVCDRIEGADGATVWRAQ